MSREQRSRIIEQLTREDYLRSSVLYNLLEEMHLHPVLTHGTGELGKDLVCHELNSLGILEWIALVVKAGNITGSTSGSRGLQTVFNQIKEAFDHPYVNHVHREVTMNKVWVVTNGRITSVARGKLVEKLKAIGPLAANVHFIQGSDLAELIEKHWPAFWSTRRDVLRLRDPMSRKVGLVLYVVAISFRRTTSLSQKGAPRARVFRGDIMTETNLSQEDVDEALNYLVKRQYLQEIGEGQLILHPKVTADRLLIELSHVQFLFQLKDIVNSEGHFSLAQARRLARDRSPSFIRQAMTVFIKGSYVEEDPSRLKGHYRLNPNCIADEYEYLDCWRRYRGGPPPRAIA